MIQLTRLNNSALLVNADLIKFVEQSPDTVITLLNGEKLLVRESTEEIRMRVIEYRRIVLQGIYPGLDHSTLIIPAEDQSTEVSQDRRR